LNSVAESIVILRPISQVGCFSACASVTSANRSAGQVRKGPPDAVRISRETSLAPPRWPSRHWKIALCSLSTGSNRTPLRSAAAVTIPPAITRISFDATARSLPASIAASAGCKPAVPTIATSTMSAASSAAKSDKPCGPAWITTSSGTSARSSAVREAS